MSRRAAAALAAALIGLSASADRGTSAADPGYADSVDQALQVLRDAPAGDRAAALRAADILEAGTGQSQREILLELRHEPPDVPDARSRLSALARADRSPAFTPEPRKAQRAVHDILAQPRYAALHQGPSISDRIRDAVVRFLAWLLDRAGGAPVSGFGWLLAAGAAAALVALLVLLLVSLRWRGRPEARASTGGAGSQARRDRFVEADRLAAAGDLAGAVRALAGAVAAALGDDRTWEISPLTVRELYSRAPDPAALRPLLAAFEAAVYGDRSPDAGAYGRAEAAAAPFRSARRAAA